MASIESLLKMTAAARPLRAYAYLTTALRGQPGDADALDCLLPFLKAGVEHQEDGAKLDYVALHAFLKTLGLRIPTLVLEHLTTRLEPLGVVEKRAGDWFVKTTIRSGSQDAAPDVLDDAFDAIECELAAFARDAFKIVEPPSSPTWTDALIAFLKSTTSLDSGESKTPNKVAPVIEGQDTLVGDPNLERLIVASFVQDCDDNPDKKPAIDRIVQVFTGILIEDFLSAIQSLNRTTNYSTLHIYYDTTIILRLLGTSGTTLRISTIDMHNCLQRLGCYIHYLGVTAGEVKNILHGILNNPEGSHPETADAYFLGELKIDDIRDFPETFETRLKDEFGITLVTNKKSVKSWEINENSLTQAIVATRTGFVAFAQDVARQEARARKDARAVAIILQLREGTVASEVGLCKHLFVSHNPRFQRVAKQFVEANVSDYDENEGSIGPVVTLGQLATLSWLLAPNKMEPVQVTRELLVACYNAVRPDVSFTKKFTESFNAYAKKNPSVVEQIAEAAIFRKTARSVMQIETLNQAAKIDSSDISEIIRQAEHTARDKDSLKAQRLEGKKRSDEKVLFDEIAESKSLAVAREAELRRLEEIIAQLQELNGNRLAVEQEIRKRLSDTEQRNSEIDTEQRNREIDAEKRSREREQTNNYRLNVIALVLIVIVPVCAFIILKNDNVAILCTIVYFVIAFPLIWIVIFKSSTISESNIIEMYKSGVTGIGEFARVVLNTDTTDLPGSSNNEARDAVDVAGNSRRPNSKRGPKKKKKSSA